jgi:hypothetical protein
MFGVPAAEAKKFVPRIFHSRDAAAAVAWAISLSRLVLAGEPWWLAMGFGTVQYWAAVVIDHFSRRAMGCAVFNKEPNSEHVRSFLGRIMHQAQAKPKYLICDKGRQFWCRGFKDWCRRKGVRPRFGAVGQHGSIAVVERFIQTVKVECTRRLLVSLRARTFRKELQWFAVWYNQHRPHTTLGGRTPASRHHPARRVSGISGKPLPEQHAVSLRRSLPRLPSGLHPGHETITSRVDPSNCHARPSPWGHQSPRIRPPNLARLAHGGEPREQG